MLTHCWWFAFAVLLAVPDTSRADVHMLKATRFGGIAYVAVRDLAMYYELGANQSSQTNRVSYRTSTAQLVAEHDCRDITLNGITHWLNVPVLETHGQLWITSLDVLKVIDPVLRQGRLPGKTPVRTIMLDPGHGGSDRGTSGKTGIEKNLTIDLAKRVRQQLEAAGFKVLQTRATDENVSLDNRVAQTESRHADLFVSLHFNSGGSATGIETYCVTPAGAASTASLFHRLFEGGDEACDGNQFDEKNVWLAHCVQRAALQGTGANDRGVRRARFVVLRNAPCPAILIEGGFLSNVTDEQRLLSTDYRDKLAKAIASGILEYRKTTE